MEIFVPNFIHPEISGLVIDGEVCHGKLSLLLLTKFATNRFDIVQVIRYVFPETLYSASQQLKYIETNDKDFKKFLEYGSIHFVLSHEVVEILQNNLLLTKSFALLSSVMISESMESIKIIPKHLNRECFEDRLKFKIIRLRSISCHLMETIMNRNTDWTQNEIVKNQLCIKDLGLKIKKKLESDLKNIMSKLCLFQKIM